MHGADIGGGCRMLFDMLKNRLGKQCISMKQQIGQRISGLRQHPATDISTDIDRLCDRPLFETVLMRRPCLILFMVLILATAAAHATPDMTAEQALAATKAGKVRVIDIRTPQEWRRTGVIPGAGRVDYYRGPQNLLQSVTQMVGGDKNTPIALICHTGVRTTHAQKFLQSQGFTAVYNVKEGMAGSASGPGWLRRGLPVESCTLC